MYNWSVELRNTENVDSLFAISRKNGQNETSLNTNKLRKRSLCRLKFSQDTRNFVHRNIKEAPLNK